MGQIKYWSSEAKKIISLVVFIDKSVILTMLRSYCMPFAHHQSVILQYIGMMGNVDPRVP